MKWLTDHKMAWLGFAVATAYWPAMLSAGFVPRWAAIAVGVPLVSKLDPRNVPASLRWILLWIIGLAAISTTWASPDRMGGYQDLIFIIILCLAFIASAGLDDLDEVMVGLGWGVAVSSLGVLWEMAVADNRIVGLPAPAGLFYNSEILAEFAAIVFVWAVLRPHLLIAGVCAIPILFCQSRIAVVIAAAALLYAFWPRRRWLGIGLAIMLLALSMSLVVILGPDKLGSAFQRIILWIATIYSWTQFGHGLGWFGATHPDVRFAHSDALQAVAEIGVGAIALIAIPIIALRKNRGNDAERAAFIAVCFETVVSFPLHFPASGFVAAMLAGFLVSRRRVVCVGGQFGATDDGCSVRRQQTADSSIIGRIGRSSRALSVRSLSALREGICAREDRGDTAAAVG